MSAAARRLNASPSAVSQQLSNLEAALGTPLLDRSTRPVTLTPAGQIFRRRAQRIQSEAQQARVELASGSLAQLTDLRLGMIEDLDADVTPALLTAIAARLQDCKFLLETGASHRLFDHLDTRVLDVIVAAELGAPADWMEVHPLLEEPFVAAVPHGAVDETQDVLAQLSALPLIRYTQRHVMGRQIAEHLAQQNLTLSPRFEMDSYHAIMAMVAQGQGWTILTPLGLARAHRFRDHAAVLPLPVAPLSRRVSLFARGGILQDMPASIADTLRSLLAELVVAPTIQRHPWLEGKLRLLR